METVNRIVVSGVVFGPVEFTEPDRGPAHARFCLSQEKSAGSRRVEHRFRCVAFGPAAMAVAASLAPGVAVVLEGELSEARAASFLDGRPRKAEAAPGGRRVVENRLESALCGPSLDELPFDIGHIAACGDSATADRIVCRGHGNGRVSEGVERLVKHRMRRRI